MKKLSICIPVLNNKDSFYQCLHAACEASKNHAQDVEIAISDNCSTEDIFSVFNHFSKLYPSLSMKYHRNSQNIGMAGNFIQSVVMANGQFCWIIGSDDFLYKDGVQRIVEIINDNSDINFICCNYDMIDANKWKPIYANRNFEGEDQLLIQKHHAPEVSKIVEKLDLLITPEINNVYLGAIMTGVFRKSVWDNVDKSDMSFNGFFDLESVYPHCAIYAKGFLHSKAFYCGDPLIVVGEGTREWSTDKGTQFWQSSLPIIYFKILGDMIDEYHRNGLNRKNYLLCMKENAGRVGQFYLSLLKAKLQIRKDIKNGDLLDPLSILKRYGRFSAFWRSIARNRFDGIKQTLRGIIK